MRDSRGCFLRAFSGLGSGASYVQFISVGSGQALPWAAPARRAKRSLARLPFPKRRGAWEMPALSCVLPAHRKAQGRALLAARFGACAEPLGFATGTLKRDFQRPVYCPRPADTHPEYPACNGQSFPCFASPVPVRPRSWPAAPRRKSRDPDPLRQPDLYTQIQANLEATNYKRPAIERLNTLQARFPFR